jgi:PAS domain S-box-containing protein
LFILTQGFIIAGLVVNRRRYRRAQVDLLQTRDRLARGQQIARLGTWERNLATGRLTWTDEVFRLYGLEPTAITPTMDFVLNAIHPEDRARTLELIAERDRTGASRRMEYRIVRADGAVRHFSVAAERHIGARGEPVLMGTVQDVTGMREMEEQVRHSQQMESVGNLAGGIAHDFNNLLTVINGYSDLLLKRMPQADPSRPAMAEIRKAGERAATLTRNLLAFSRKQVIRPEPVRINDILSELTGLLQPMLGGNVELHLHLSPDLPDALLDRARFEQSVLNLASNAHDAMQTGGGKFAISTRLTAVEHGCSHPWIEIAFRDSGHGMDAETQRRIFDPFFTTKPKGKGTGLGLPSVYGFVRQSGGQLSVESAPGQGTQFTMRLPCVQCVNAVRAETAQAAPESCRAAPEPPRSQPL